MAVPEAILRSASDGRRAASKRMAIMQRLRAEHRKNWPACRTGCIFPEYTHALLSPLLEANQPSILSDQGHQPLGGELMLVDALGWGCCHPTVCMLHLWGSAVSTLIRLLSVDNVIPSRLRVGSPKAGGILGITESDSDSDSGDAAS